MDDSNSGILDESYGNLFLDKTVTNHYDIMGELEHEL